MISHILHVLALTLGLRFGIATTFSRHDAGNPNPALACVYDRHFKHKILDDQHDIGIALPRRYACLSHVFIYNRRTHRGDIFRVLDRGPKNALVDMTKLAARKIGSNGKDPVIMFRWPPPPTVAEVP